MSSTTQKKTESNGADLKEQNTTTSSTATATATAVVDLTVVPIVHRMPVEDYEKKAFPLGGQQLTRQAYQFVRQTIPTCSWSSRDAHSLQMIADAAGVELMKQLQFSGHWVATGAFNKMLYDMGVAVGIDKLQACFDGHHLAACIPTKGATYPYSGKLFDHLVLSFTVPVSLNAVSITEYSMDIISTKTSTNGPPPPPKVQ